MGEPRLYFDWNAGAPVCEAARDGLVAALSRPANPSAVHAEGRSAHAAVETARRQVAALVGADAKGVTFVSCGTEAAVTVLTPDWTLFGKPFALDRLVISAVEHPAVARGGRFPADRVDVIAVDADGVIDLGALDAHLGRMAARGERALVSVMLANNETGVIEPVAEVARIAHAHGALVHSDAVQAAGKIAVDISALDVDVLTLSSLKIGGGPGAGAIVRGRNGFAFAPLLTGGGQELWARAGTPNVPAIVAFGAAAAAADPGAATMGDVARRRDRIAAQVRAAVPGVVVFGEGVMRLANTLAFAVPGREAERLVIAFDLAGVALSSGAACSSGKVASSPVLKAMGVADGLLKGALRISIGPATTDAEIERFGAILQRVMGPLRKQQETYAA